MILSILYISHSLIGRENADQKVEEIVKKSVESNAKSGVTGALIHTGINFCQLLEGPKDNVQKLMESISKDTRHKDIWMVHQESLTERRFANWSMAYSGRSDYVSSFLSNIIETSTEEGRRKASNAVVEVMKEFAKIVSN